MTSAVTSATSPSHNPRMKHLFFQFLFTVTLLLASSSGWPHPFAAVFVDDATEQALGPFPYDRGLYAQAIESLRQAGAKAVVIKYFLDQAKPGDGDDQLAAEMKKIPVLLQARLDNSESHPNPLPLTLDRSASL